MIRKEFLRNTGICLAGATLSPKMNILSQKTGKGSSLVDANLTEAHTADFDILLDTPTQNIVSLKPKGQSFDFMPFDRCAKREGANNYYLGDMTIRIRQSSSGDWVSYTSVKRKGVATNIEATNSTIAASDISALFEEGFPLVVKRFWKSMPKGITVSFEIENPTNAVLEIGALGFAMVFNNILTDRHLDEAHQKCSFADPYIGLDAGYLQVTRLSGQGPALVVMSDKNTPFEAYRLLADDKMGRWQTFEGFYEWMTHSQAYVENEWKEATPWNVASFASLQPSEKKIYTLKFLMVDSIRSIDAGLQSHNKPVAVGVPGYVVSIDQDASLFVKTPREITSIEIAPKDAIKIISNKKHSKNGHVITLQGKTWGRARMTINYHDGFKQTIHYKVVKDHRQVLSDLGSFLQNKQWFVDDKDPFGRSSSFVTYDYFADKKVTQERRAWIAGLSDEGGNGSWLAMIMKQLIAPDKSELDNIQKFVDNVLDGGLQYNKGEYQYGVRKSMFYYAPKDFPEGTYSKDIEFGGWESWNKKEAESPGRSYNYPPVAAAYWVLYRLARNFDGLVTNHSWKWYLERAVQTVIAMDKYASYYTQFGQMEGTVFVKILEDLKHERWTTFQNQFEAIMKKRAKHWDELQYPFGSEMPWDSTGQEEVYAWCRYFGFKDKAKVTIDAITGYMPTVPHWGYNGNARRYWDFIYAGKLQRIERQIHHYGSGMNAIPILTAYRDNPADFYLLRVGYGGLLGSISNITIDGFGPCAFHSFAETLKIDGYSGDYGPNFLGHVLNTRTFIVRHPEWGWISYGGNMKESKNEISVVPTDSSRSRVYFSFLKMGIILDAGNIRKISFKKDGTGSINIVLFDLSKSTSNARLRVQQDKNPTMKFLVAGNFQKEREAWVIPFQGKDEVKIKLTKA